MSSKKLVVLGIASAMVGYFLPVKGSSFRGALAFGASGVHLSSVHLAANLLKPLIVAALIALAIQGLENGRDAAGTGRGVLVTLGALTGAEFLRLAAFVPASIAPWVGLMASVCWMVAGLKLGTHDQSRREI